MQRTAAQLTEADRVADLQASRRIAEFAGLATIEVEFQKTIFLRQAGQRIGPRDVVDPQHQMLSGAVAQRPLHTQAQAQDAVAEPVQRFDDGQVAILDRVERVHLQIFDYLTLARQTPTLLALLGAQGVRPIIRRGKPRTHCTRHAWQPAGATTVGHGHTVLIKGVEQIAARRHRPLPVTDAKFRASTFSHAAAQRLRPSRLAR